MVKLFTIERVNSSPASFDPKKLIAFQGDTFAQLPLATRIERTKPFADRAGLLGTPEAEEKLAKVVEGANDRLKMAGDILDFDYFFLDAFTFNDKAFNKRICKPQNARPLLLQLRDHLAQIDFSGADQLEQQIGQFCLDAKIELKDIIHAIRVATTGQAGGFGMFDTLEILGKGKVLGRIDAALERAATICTDS